MKTMKKKNLKIPFKNFAKKNLMKLKKHQEN